MNGLTVQPDERTTELDAALELTPPAGEDLIDHLGRIRCASRYHMEAGRAILRVVERYEAACVDRDGDTPAIRQQARGTAYQYMADVASLSRDTIKLYARCYEKFGDSWDAIVHLTLSDMQLLLPASVDDDLIAHIVEARKFDPNLRREEVKTIVRECRAGRRLTKGTS
ncbi:hypothetical protein [Paraburkholderia sp. 40]|uniref:hypothetical protein n=1 Tax=Paraburkholderia sp. 40 TaxID=2991059 RepID=UPI003D1AA90C